MTYIDVIGHKYVDGVCSECGAVTVTNGLAYSYDTDTQSYTITDYTGRATEVVIPSVHNDGINGEHPVASIGNRAFRGATTLTSVTIPDSVYAIGQSAFYGTAWYASQPDGVVYAGKVAYGYKGTMPKNTSVVLKEGTLGIAEGAFLECGGLNSITIPSSVKYVKEGSFFCCYDLASITVNDGNAKYHSTGNCLIETASKTLVQGCNTSAIPDDGSVTSIGLGAFAGTGIMSITIPDSVTSIGASAFTWCFKLKAVVIGDGVTDIEYNAFCEDLNLTSVVLGKSVTNIGRYAFDLCYELIEVYNRSALTLTIGSEDNGCIAECAKNVYTDTEGQSKLSTDEDGYVIYTDDENKFLMGYIGTETELTLPNGITEIYQYAFINEFLDYSSGITSIVIPDSVKIIGQSAFNGCTDLENITIGTGIEMVGDYAFNDTAWYNSQPDGLIYIGKVAYKYKGTMPEETDIKLKDGTVRIGGGAFEDCTGLTSITIPSSVCSIGKDAFHNCENLTSVHIIDLTAWCKITFGSNPLSSSTRLYINGERPSGDIVIEDGVTSIPAYTFDNCADVTSVTIPDSVTNIGAYAFHNTAWYDAQPDGLVYAGKVAYKYKGAMPENTAIEIEAGTKGIAGYAFVYCNNLANITIPDSVTNIGDYAFSSCKSLTSIIIPEGVTNIGSSAFYGCYKLVEVYNKSSLDITVGSQTNGHVAYYAKNVYTDTDGQSKLSTDEDGYIIYTDGEDKILMRYVGTETELTLPEGITEIYQYAFYRNKNIKGIIIPEKVTSIGKSVFEDCTGLTTVSWNATICSMYIGSIPDPYDPYGDYSYVFSGCSKLTTINIGNKVTKIPEYAFSGCRGLTSVHITDLTAWCGIEFGGYYSNPLYCAHNLYLNGTLVTDLVIPNDVTEIKAYAFVNATCLTSVTISDSVEGIGDFAFSGCTGLTSVTIGNSITNIGNSVFRDCYTLTSLHITDLSAWCGIEFGSNPLSYATNLYLNGTLVTDLVIPNDVTEIKAYAFYNATCLTSVTIPDSVNSIGYGAFAGCTGVTSLKYNGTKEQWSNIEGISSSNLPPVYTVTCSDGVVCIKHQPGTLIADTEATCTQNGSGHKACTVCGKTVTQTTISALGHDLILTITNQATCAMEGSGKKTCSRCGYEEAVTFPKTPHDIVSGVCSICGQDELDGTAGLKYEFDSDTQSYSVVEYCGADDVIIIPSTFDDGVNDIHPVSTIKWLINDLSEESLLGLVYSTVIIPDSVTKMGPCMWGYNRYLTHIYISSANPVYHVADNCLIETATKTLIAGCKSSVIPDDGSVTSIGPYAFGYCLGLAEIVIPDCIESIGENAFDTCIDLVKVTIGSGVKSIGENAFDNCYKLVEIYNKSTVEIDETEFNFGHEMNVYTSVSETKISYIGDYVIYTDGGRKILMGYLGDEYDIVLPNGIEEIYPFAFAYNMRLVRVVISDTVEKIGDCAFAGCFSLAHLTIGAGVKEVGYLFVNECVRLVEIYNKSNLSYNELCNSVRSDVNIYTNANGGKVKISDDGFVYYGTTIAGYIGTETEITIEKALRDYALIGSKFKSVTINVNVSVATFLACLDLTNVTISGGRIEENAFDGCVNLTDVTISDSVKSIGYGAFYGCTSLTSITYEGTMEEWNAINKDNYWGDSALKTVVCTDGTISL